MTVVLFGYSDDCIEVDGAIHEEWPFHGDEAVVGFSDGTAAKIKFDDGVWRITVVALGSCRVELTPAPVGDESNYTDRLVLTGDVRWAVLGSAITGAGR